MNLEDHLGDIIRKARAMSNVSTVTAAQAAGLTEAELAALEESGQAAKKPDYEKLASLIGLHPEKLQSIADGWLPRDKDLGKWPELRPLATAAEGITVNCYLIWDEITREAALFDTGWDATPALELLLDNKLQLRHLFLTHSHPDHIAGV